MERSTFISALGAAAGAAGPPLAAVIHAASSIDDDATPFIGRFLRHRR